MKILIVSDTHRKDDVLLRVLRIEKPIDLLIHAGDAEGSEDAYPRIAECPVRFVSGNNDFYSPAPPEDVFDVKGGHRIFLTHGHIYNVYSNSDRIAQLAKAYKADIAVYGHTHYPEIRRQDSVLVMNPGSLGYPRQAGHRPSYIILNIAEDGTADPGLRYVPEGRG